MFNFDIQFISMRKLITSILPVILLGFTIKAQTATNDYVLPKSNENLRDKISASVTAGTGVGFVNSSKNAVFNSFIAPQVRYRLSPKFNLNIGMMHYTLSGNSLLSNSVDYTQGIRHNSFQNNFNAASVGLEYKISDRSSIGINTIIGNGSNLNPGYNSNTMPGISPFSYGSMYPFGMFSSFGR